MSDQWLMLLDAKVKEVKSKQKAADFIGISRTAVSLALARKYPSKSIAKLEAKVLRALSGTIACPPLGETIKLEDCAAMRIRRTAPSLPEHLHQWLACEDCPIGARLMLPHRTDKYKKEKPHAQR